MYSHIFPVFYALSLGFLLITNPVDCRKPRFKREAHPLSLNKGPHYDEAVVVIDHHQNPTHDDHDDDSSHQSASWYLVPKKDMKPWVSSMVTNPYEGYLSKSGSVFVLNRRRRQTGGGGPAGPGGPSIAGTPAANEIKLTPVLEPINGTKKYDEVDCKALEEVAPILRSAFKPKHKRAMIEATTCLLGNGLECVSIEERAGSGVFRKRCRCMAAFGNKPVLLERSNGKKCYIPAGKGWVSECHNKTWTDYGYPLPFGDPPGANADPAAQDDAINRPDGSQEAIPYIKWNTIKPKCVPHAECRERGTYIGQRCQCRKGSQLNHKEGTCSNAPLMILKEKMIVISSTIVFLMNN